MERFLSKSHGFRKAETSIGFTSQIGIPVDKKIRFKSFMILLVKPVVSEVYSAVHVV